MTAEKVIEELFGGIEWTRDAGREQSQRDYVLQPKVARNELPWVCVPKWKPTPTGLWLNVRIAEVSPCRPAQSSIRLAFLRAGSVSRNSSKVEYRLTDFGKKFMRLLKEVEKRQAQLNGSTGKA